MTALPHYVGRPRASVTPREASMRSTFRRLPVPAILLGSLVTTGVAAQAPTASSAATGCTYATCAVRVEQGFFTQRLVRGMTGEELGTLDFFGGGVETLLAGSDSAAVHAQSYVWHTK